MRPALTEIVDAGLICVSKPMTQALFGEIRSLLQTPYQPRHWSDLLALLYRWKDQDALRAQVIPYAQAHLSRWPQGEGHQRWAPNDWYHITPDGELVVSHEGLALANAIKFKPSTLTHPRHARWLSDPQRHHLCALTLHHQNISPELILALFQNPSLRELDLGWNLLGRLSLATLMTHLLQTKIERLRLGYAGLDDAALMSLAQAPQLSQLKQLGLRNNEIGLIGIIALTQSPHLGQLTALDLTQLRLKDAIGALFDHDAWPSLKSISLAGNGVELYGAEAIARSALLPKLESLDLSYNQLGDEGLEVLLAAPDLSALRTLNLSHNGITEAGVSALARCPKLGALRSLTLGPALSSASIVALSSSPHLPEALKRGFLSPSSGETG